MKHKKPETPEERKEPESKGGDTEELRRQVESLQKEKEELFGRLQRLSADYANFQKRVPRQIADTITYEKEKMIKVLLPVLDNFERTLHNAGSVGNSEAFAKGVGIIYNQMLDILKLYGIEQIKATGEKFDPLLHEAITHQVNEEQPDGIVLEEFQKGYKIEQRVLRPSKVMVNKLPAEQLPLPQQNAEQDSQQKTSSDESGEQTTGEYESTDTEQE